MARSIEDTQERTRRAFSRRRWARRWLGWRRVVAALLVLVVLAVGGYALWFSSWLAVNDVSVTGTSQLSVQQVEKAADVPLGDPLARIDLDAIRTRVQALSMVRSADVTRAWPHGVSIAITERQAVAVVQIGSGLRGMDADGVVFRDYRTAPPGLPRVQTAAGITSEALQEAAKVVSALPDDLAARVDHVEVQTVDQISLALRDGRTVEWGSADDSAQKAEVLAVLLQQDAQTYDVSVPGNPTTR